MIGMNGIQVLDIYCIHLNEPYLTISTSRGSIHGFLLRLQGNLYGATSHLPRIKEPGLAKDETWQKLPYFHGNVNRSKQRSSASIAQQEVARDVATILSKGYVHTNVCTVCRWAYHFLKRSA